MYVGGFLEYLIKYVDLALIYPGKYALWSAAALPPWIPKEAGHAVFEAARKALQRRFDRILRG